MLGDVNIGEPGALIGFAGPRVVKDTTGKDLPKGFQTAEFVLDHGFLDFISHRKDLKKKINLYLDLILNNQSENKTFIFSPNHLIFFAIFAPLITAYIIII